MRTEPLADLSSLVSFVGIFIAAITAIGPFVFFRLKSDVEYRRQKAEQIRGVNSRYYTELTRLLHGMQLFWGSPFSAHALGICILFQLLFSSFFFLVFWAGGGPGKIGNTSLLPQWEALGDRWLFLLGFFLYSIAIAMTIRYSANLDFSIRKLIKQSTSEQGRVLLVVTSWAAVLISLVLIIYLMGAVRGFATLQLLAISLAFLAIIAAGVSLPGFAPFMVALSWIAMAVIVAPFIFEGAAPSLVALASIVGFASSFWLATRGNPEYSNFGTGVGIAGSICSFFVGYLIAAGVKSETTFANPVVIAIILFLILLPVINGFFDWLSFAIFRLIGRGLLLCISDDRPRSWLNITLFSGYISAGIAWGVVCMLLLVASLTASINEFNMAARAEGFPDPLPLGGFIAAIEANSTGPEARWILLILLTTLLPVCGYVVSVMLFPFSKVLFSVQQREALAMGLLRPRRRGDLGPYYAATIHLLARIAVSIIFFTILLVVLYLAVSGAFDFGRWLLLTDARCVLSLTQTGSIQPCILMLK